MPALDDGHDYCRLFTDLVLLCCFLQTEFLSRALVLMIRIDIMWPT